MRDDESNATRAVIIERSFDAPRELVFRMWSEPEFLMRWYAPRRCRLEIRHFEFREGGEFRYRIWEPDGGTGCPQCSAVFTEISAPERIVYTMCFTDEQNRFLSAKSAVGKEDWPDRTTVTVTFVERNGRTIMTLHQTVPESLAKRTGAHASWLEMFDRLAEGLPAEDQVR